MRTVEKRFSENDAEPKISKTVKSKNRRTKRMLFIPHVGQERPANICIECGYHVRGNNHLEGAHHNGNVAPCHRGR